MFEVKAPKDAKGKTNNGNNGNGKGGNRIVLKKINDFIFNFSTGIKARQEKAEKKTGMKDQTATSLETASLAVETIMKTKGISAPSYEDVEKALSKGFLGC